MADWLSEEWLSEAAGLTELLPPVPGANGIVDLAISTAPRKEVHLNWRYVEGAPGGGAAGPHPEANLSLTISSADAVPVLTGDIEPSVAFMRGRLKASGDGGLLLGFLESTNDSGFASWRERVQGLGLPTRPETRPHPTVAPAPNTGPMAKSLTDVSDGALVVAIGRWHDDAIAEVFRRHAGAVFALARRVLGDPSRAEEIVQEVFVRLWNQPERFDPERGSLRSFLLAQTHGRSVDLLRSEGSRKNREAKDARAAAESGYDLEHEVWDLAVAEQVREAVLSLPEDERRAIELAYFGGRTYREAAVELGTPEGTVKSRIRSGLKRMRSVLAETGVGATWSD